MVVGGGGVGVGCWLLFAVFTAVVVGAAYGSVMLPFRDVFLALSQKHGPFYSIPIHKTSTQQRLPYFCTKLRRCVEARQDCTAHNFIGAVQRTRLDLDLRVKAEVLNPTVLTWDVPRLRQW